MVCILDSMRKKNATLPLWSSSQHCQTTSNSGASPFSKIKTKTKGTCKVKRELHVQVSAQEPEGLGETEELGYEMELFIYLQIFGGMCHELGTDRPMGTPVLGALTL